MKLRTMYAYDDTIPKGVDGVELLGRKGMNLRRLQAAGFTVPPFLTLTTDVCQAYYDAGRALPPGLVDEVMSVAERFAKAPDVRVAVRSGAPMSMPGVLKTCLRVPLEATALTAAIEDVLDSWNAEGAIAYRQAMGSCTATGTAVTIQQMVEPEWAGVAFSDAGGDASSHQLRVELVRGSGEGVVDGSVKPWQMLLSRDRKEVVSCTHPDDLAPPDNPALFPALCACVVAIERLFGEAVDVEWGCVDNCLHIFQARAIAGDANARRLQQAEIARIKDLCSRGEVRLRHNLHESVPRPTPLTWSLLQQFMSGQGGFGKMYRALGFLPSKRVDEEGFLELLAGRIYVDPDRQAELFGPWPLKYDHAHVTSDPAVMQAAPMSLDVEQVGPRFLLSLPQLVWAWWHSRRTTDRLRRDARREMDAFVADAYGKTIAANRLPKTSSIKQLATCFRRRCQFVLDEAAPMLYLPGLLGGLAFHRLQTKLTQLLGDDGERLARELVSGLASSSSPLDALLSGATGKLSVDALLAVAGHRCFEEMELSAPRWVEQPHVLRAIVEDLNKHAADTQQKQRPSCGSDAGAHQRLADALTQAGVRSELDDVQRQLTDARQLLPYRERGKDCLMKGFAYIREVAEALGQATGMDDAIYFLEIDELETAGSEASVRRAQQRREQWNAMQSIVLPQVVSKETMMQQTTDARSQVQTVSGGMGRGIIYCPSAQRAPPSPPFVLLTPTLSPDLIRFMPAASAIIAEQGGFLSHAALIAREMGVPTVVLQDACTRFHPGDFVTVDADGGAVHELQGRKEVDVG